MALSAAEEALIRELIAENPQLLSLADNEATIISKLGATKKNLSELASAMSLNDTDLAFVRQGSSDKSVALSVLKAFAVAGVPSASETDKGIAELATTAEATAGTDDLRIMTPLKVAQSIAVNTFAKIQPVTASVASNALTLTLNATKLDFRSSTLSDGTVNSRTVSSPISVVVPSGATLGTVNSQAARLVMLAIDNAGTVELAVVNIAGGVNLDETTLISTTAISAASNSASTVYSTTARTGVPFRVVGFIDITETTAGTWATDATRKQGVGGQAGANGVSMVRLNTPNGYGSTNNKIRRFNNVVVNHGADITYSDSPTLGASLTINTPGVYSISYGDQFTTTSSVGLSLNTTSPTAQVYTIPATEILSICSSPAANAMGVASWTGKLNPGDIVRPHTDGTASGTTVNAVQFTITRVS